MDFLRFIKRRSSSSSSRTRTDANQSLKDANCDPNDACTAPDDSCQNGTNSSKNGNPKTISVESSKKQTSPEKTSTKKGSLGTILARKISKLSAKRSNRRNNFTKVTSSSSSTTSQDDENQAVISGNHVDDGDESGLITRDLHHDGDGDDVKSPDGDDDGGVFKGSSDNCAESASLVSNSSPNKPARSAKKQNKGGVKDGRYFIEVMDKEKLRIEVQVVRAEQDLSTGTVPEEVCGCLRAAAGKGRLLMDKKFLQFRTLCEKNLKPTGKEEQVLLEDLAGFWDLVSIQIEEIHGTFDQIEVLRSNGWRHPHEHLGEDDGHQDDEHNENVSLLGKSKSASTAKKTKSLDIQSARGKSTAPNKKRPSLPNTSTSAIPSTEKTKKNDEDRRRRISELRQKMKKEQTEKKFVDLDGDGNGLSDIVVFEASEKQKLRA